MPLCTCGRPLVPTRRFDTETVMLSAGGNVDRRYERPAIDRRQHFPAERRTDAFTDGLSCTWCGAFYPESAESVAWD